MPEITVLMPVRNGELYIKESINSILCQSFSDFELLIMDDGSTDETVNIIQSFSDARIRLEKREHNFIKNLNEGLFLSKGNYIARMDADDRMHNERLRIQHKRMIQNSDIAVCSTWTHPFKTDDVILPPAQSGKNYIENALLQLFRGNFIVHPSVMINKKFLTDNDLVYQEYPYAEDYKLWFEIAKLGGKIFVEPQCLLYFRISETQVSHVKQKEQIETSRRIKHEILDYLIEQTQSTHPEIKDLYNSLFALKEKDLFTTDDVFGFFYQFFSKNKLSLFRI